MKNIIIFVATLFSFALIPIGSVSADENRNVVTPIMPESQIGEVSNYFNTQWTPGKSDRMGITLKNTQDEDKTYLIEVNKGITNANGLITYNKNDNEEMKSFIDGMAIPEKFTVKANSENSFNIDFRYNDESLSGIEVIGIQLKEEYKPSKDKQFNQEIAYVIPMIINGDLPKKDISIKFNNFEFERLGGGLYSIKTPFINENANFLQSAKADVIVEKDGKEIINDSKTIDISPRTTVLYAPSFNKSLESGEYDVTITITTKLGKVFTSKQKVSLSEEQAKEITKTVNIGEKKKVSLFANLYFDLLVILISSIVGYAVGKTIKKRK